MKTANTKQKREIKNPFVIIAAHNESKHIVEVINECKQYTKNIVVGNDGSTDDTKIKAQKTNVFVVSHIINQGKGAVMKTAAQFAITQGADALIFVDGDGQHEPKEIPKFLQLLKTTDIVFGERKREGSMPFILRFGNWFISSLIKTLYGLNISDSQCGYRAMTKEAYENIEWSSKDYSVESEMIANAGRHKLRYKQLQINTIYHDKYKGTTPLHGFPIVWNLLMWRFRG